MLSNSNETRKSIAIYTVLLSRLSPSLSVQLESSDTLIDTIDTIQNDRELESIEVMAVEKTKTQSLFKSSMDRLDRKTWRNSLRELVRSPKVANQVWKIASG